MTVVLANRCILQVTAVDVVVETLYEIYYSNFSNFTHFCHRFMVKTMHIHLSSWGYLG
jgi:hypothetical protein